MSKRLSRVATAPVPMLSLGALLGGVLLVACVTSEQSAGSGTPTPSPSTTSSGGFKPPPTGPADTPPPPDPLTDPDAGDCSLEPNTFYGFTLQTLTFKDPVPTCRFKGKVLLVVNVASQCGFTPQYAPLQAIYEKYKAQGFFVLGFPSDSFNQELGTEQEISKFCTDTYKITFPMFSLGNVNPPNEQPLYTWLKAQSGYGAPIPWNFEKWVISKKGTIAKRIDYRVQPNDAQVTSAIEAELAK